MTETKMAVTHNNTMRHISAISHCIISWCISQCNVAYATHVNKKDMVKYKQMIPWFWYFIICVFRFNIIDPYIFTQLFRHKLIWLWRFPWFSTWIPQEIFRKTLYTHIHIFGKFANCVLCLWWIVISKIKIVLPSIQRYRS